MENKNYKFKSISFKNENQENSIHKYEPIINISNENKIKLKDNNYNIFYNNSKDNTSWVIQKYKENTRNMNDYRPNIIKTKMLQTIAIGVNIFHYSIIFRKYGSDNELSDRLLNADPSLLNSKSIHGMTALMYACKLGDSQGVDFLIKKGANIYLKNNFDFTAFDYTKSEQIKELLKNNSFEDLSYFDTIKNLHTDIKNKLESKTEERKKEEIQALEKDISSLKKSLKVSSESGIQITVLESLQKQISDKEEEIKKIKNIPQTIKKLNLKIDTIDKGKKLYNNWITNTGVMDKIQILYNKYYELEQTDYNATVFNDLYKWMMLPIMRKLEEAKGEIIVTFQLDIRDAVLKKDLINKNTGLREKIIKSLENLRLRKFNKKNFIEICKYKDLIKNNIIKDSDIDSICFNDGIEKEGNERSLVDGLIYNNEESYLKALSDKNTKTKVNVGCFEKEFEKEEDKNYIIEVSGPWHKVTWLETSLMQCVHQTVFLHYNNKKSYIQYIIEALQRCAISVAQNHSIQDEQNNNGDVPIKCALFTNRRTNSLLFILLQNLFFAHNYNNYNKDNTSHHICLGTSSCDSKLILDKEFGVGHCLGPVGTHAHEISMVGSVLYPELDKDFIPFTQVLGHYLYRNIVLQKKDNEANAGPMPMLPDTLGTRNFLHAANLIDVASIGNIKGNGTDTTEPFLKRINGARQDSGSLSDFIKTLIDYKYIDEVTKVTKINQGNKKVNMAQIMSKTDFKNKYGLMASEIDSPDALIKASDLCYASFGAGGFFGDTANVWDDEKSSSYSIAVKVVRVHYTQEGRNSFKQYPHFQQKYNNSNNTTSVTTYPIKTGDPKDRIKGMDLSQQKLSYNKKLGPGFKNDIIKTYIEKVLEKDYELTPKLKEDKKELNDFESIINYFKLVSGKNLNGTKNNETNSNNRYNKERKEDKDIKITYNKLFDDILKKMNIIRVK